MNEQEINQSIKNVNDVVNSVNDLVKLVAIMKQEAAKNNLSDQERDKKKKDVISLISQLKQCQVHLITDVMTPLIKHIKDG